MDVIEFILRWGWIIVPIIYFIVKFIQKRQDENAQQTFTGFPAEIQPYIDKVLNALYGGEKTMQVLNIIGEGDAAQEGSLILSVLTDPKMYSTIKICSDGRIMKNGKVLCYWDNASYRKPNGTKMYTFTNNGLPVFFIKPEFGTLFTEDKETYITELSDTYRIVGCDEYLDLIKKDMVYAKKSPSKASSKTGKKKVTKD